MSEARRAYDPIPDLAGLLAALTASRAASWDGQVGAAYRRLAEGLAWTGPSAIEDAIRETLTSFITGPGHLLTPAELGAYVAEAERGYETCPQCGNLVPDLNDCRGHKMDCTHWMAEAERGETQIAERIHRHLSESASAGDLEQVIRRATPDQLHRAVSTTWDPERYAELAEAMTAEPGQDPLA
jgi:hypothetical protein